MTYLDGTGDPALEVVGHGKALPMQTRRPEPLATHEVADGLMIMKLRVSDFDHRSTVGTARPDVLDICGIAASLRCAGGTAASRISPSTDESRPFICAAPRKPTAQPMVILNTQRLLLRRFEPADLAPLYALYSDAEIRRYYPDGTRTLQETKEELDWFIHGHPRHPELGLWATVERNSGEFLGRCGLLPWHIQGQDEVELAFMIRKDRWREGLATEAARGIIDHAHRVLGLRRLVCLIMRGNTASAGVAEKVGMAFERSFMDEHGPCDLYALALPER
jgi:[ribosomal protein S5]-alanine N-acetyltransferase